jgi:hypothetical protein
MKFFARFCTLLHRFLVDSKNTPPYPLCEDEWETIQELEHKSTEARSLKSLGLQENADNWIIPGRPQARRVVN